ncbi:hypothetical protein LOC51_19895 [Rubrivivax sp. JA1024]|nr:hypothetical protein [Rubrivivax sp. JA1024]
MSETQSPSTKYADMSDADLLALAQSIGVDVFKGDASGLSRDDLIAAIELHEEAQVEAAAKQLAADEAAQAASVAREAGDRSPSDQVIRRLNADFSRDVPQAARSGEFDPAGDPRFGGEYDVPNGRYRVVGCDWVFQIKSKKLASVLEASPANKWGGKSVVMVG